MALLRLLLVTVLFAASACASNGEGNGAGGTDGPTTTTDGTDAATCTAEADGFEVEYPVDWHTNDTSEAEPCRFFHPAPFEVQPDTEATEIAIVLRFTSAPFEQLTSATLEDPGGARLLAQEQTTVAGEEALRIETESTGEALLPAGTLAVQWFAEFGGRTMVAVTLDTIDQVAFDEATEVLDAMMRSLRRVSPPDSAACSAAGMAAEPEEQPGLPAEVADARRAIVEAAVECDFDRLEELALGGSTSFSYSFGEDGDPAGYWRRQEASDRPPQPLRFLVGLLDRPYRLLEPEHGGTAHYVWPSAFGYDSWDAVPEEEKEALKPLYSEEDFTGFEQFGGYIGYRVGITVDGDWMFFVAGD